MKATQPLTKLKRYSEVAFLLWKYGRSGLAKQLSAAGIEDPADGAFPAKAPAPAELADDLEAMGPTFVKLGQVLGSRSDFLPDAYVAALSRLHDNVEPFAFADVERMVQDELGVRLSKAFAEFSVTPVAAASLGQVHLARLRSGKPVAVKVQRPHIADRINQDFEVLSQIAEFLDAHTEAGKRYRFINLLEEFRITIRQELDYEREAQNLIEVGHNLEEFELITVPQPVTDYCSKRVLTMDYVHGRKVTALSPLTALQVDGSEMAEQLFKCYLKQVLVDGLFHADPHPGNVFLTDDQSLALLDLGMVGRTTPGMQESLIKLLIAISEGKGEDASDVVMRISEARPEFNAVSFRERMAKLVLQKQGQGLAQLNIGRSLLDLNKLAVDGGLHVPSDLALLGKTLLQLDELGRILDPRFEPAGCVRRNVAEIMAQRMRKSATQGSFLKSALEFKQLIAGFPAKLNDIVNALSDSRLEIRVKAVDADTLMEGLQKVANRIASGLVLAALIVGAALLMRVETSFRLFGYPGLAILCFLGAAAGGLYLLVSIFLQDRAYQKR
jgi:predicted unusual protein kinase regulating ubiquinone biosynthesis (AarF/ABC1/UbiB family)